MKRFEMLVKSAGTRMDDAPLYELTVIDLASQNELLRKTVYEDLTKYEIEKYIAHFNEVMEVVA